MGIIYENLMLILISIISFITVVFLIIFIIRTLSLRSLQFKLNPIQKAELIKNKMFVTSDLYHLNVFQKDVVSSEYLIIGVHDFKTNFEEFRNLANYLDEQDNFSYLFYNQRGVGNNKPFLKPNQGSLLKDLKEIIEEVTARYNKKIILLASGTSASAALYFSQDERIHKIVIPNLTVNPPYKEGVGFKIQKGINNVLTLNGILLNQKYSGYDFTDSKEIAQELDRINQDTNFVTYKEYLQNQKFIKNIVKNINKSKINILLFLLNNDFYCRKEKMTKIIQKCNTPFFKTQTILNEKHFWLWENKSDNFKKLIANFE